MIPSIATLLTFCLLALTSHLPLTSADSLEARFIPTGSSMDWEYYGCYDLFGASLSGGVDYIYHPGFTLETCLVMCERQGYGFASLDHRSWCGCYRNPLLNLALIDGSKCDIPCINGPAGATCGGLDALGGGWYWASVYRMSNLAAVNGHNNEQLAPYRSIPNLHSPAPVILTTAAATPTANLSSNTSYPNTTIFFTTIDDVYTTTIRDGQGSTSVFTVFQPTTTEAADCASSLLASGYVCEPTTLSPANENPVPCTVVMPVTYTTSCTGTAYTAVRATTDPAPPGKSYAVTVLPSASDGEVVAEEVTIVVDDTCPCPTNIAMDSASEASAQSQSQSQSELMTLVDTGIGTATGRPNSYLLCSSPGCNAAAPPGSRGGGGSPFDSGVSSKAETGPDSVVVSNAAGLREAITVWFWVRVAVSFAVLLVTLGLY